MTIFKIHVPGNMSSRRCRSEVNASDRQQSLEDMFTVPV